MRDLIDQYKGDIVSIDYKLYEDIEDALSGRIDVLQMLLDHDQSGISLEKLKELHDSYCSLVAGLTQLKDDVQSASRNAARGRVR
jgi:hypothetical protein